MRKYLLLALFVSTCLPALVLAQAPNILFYGNSFTIAVGFGSTRSVDNLVGDIAVAAGNARPYTRSAAAANQSLEWHRLNNSAPIINGIAAGQKWDFVVLQDFSTQPTRLGNTALHRSSYVGLYQLVRNHSPNVKAVGFETWARGPGHTYYLGASPIYPGGPAQMQAELRAGYDLSTADLNSLYPGVSEVSRIGDAWQTAGFPGNYYASDIYHAANRGTLLTSLILYASIYDDNTVTDLNLSGILATLGLSAADGAAITSAAQQTLPEPSACLAFVGFAALLVRRRP